YPHDPELLFRGGIIYRECGDLPRAEESYLKLFTNRATGHIDSIDVTMTTYKARHNLALIYQDMGKLADAEAQFREALKHQPGFVPSWMGLGELYLRQRRFEDCWAVANHLEAISPGAGGSLLGRLLQAKG